MGRPKKSVPQYGKPAERNQHTEGGIDAEEEAVTEFNRDDQEPAGGIISKAEAVRLALAAGMEKPQEAVDWIRKHHSIEMGKPTWSSYRAQQKTRDEKKAAAAHSPRKQSGLSAPRQAATAPRAAAPTTQGAGIVDDIEDIRRLIGVHGEQGLKRLIDVLG